MSHERQELYRLRFAEESRRKRDAMWAVLCRVALQRYVASTDTVLDLGAGLCEFINNIKCGAKLAVDGNPSLREHAREGVRVVVGEIPAVLAEIPDASVHVVFCSNFFEHLRDKAELMEVLRHIRRMLVPGGRLVVVQPNIRYAYKEYWDFFDHHVPLSHKSLAEAVEILNFAVEVSRPKFLPYTTKSRIPQSAWLVRLYLMAPPLQWLLGKQMLLVARRGAP